ncbi:hypothetical protein F0L74_09980 [Chitinophaga agrisoli]|uniref:Uncharacterized protein n=1 Tax=Chitinophaga agrisoli TaxID=2607653 RepID=A0A5B2VX53_9BACT|nr:hypothetical protein [Chitinophaga agrisoli]KAA2242847.1 hypothetical protein F0L74_09980 [Chitinophaga agrisoli]
MTTLVGRTFSYRYHGKEVTRKVIKMIIRKTKRIYELLDPTTHLHSEAYADQFDKAFKHRPTGPVIRDKKHKGNHITSKQLNNLY